MKQIFHILRVVGILIGFCIIVSLILGNIENIEFGESLYRTFLLMATVTEYPAKTMLGKLFSGIAVIFGLGLILYIVVSISRLIVQFDVQKILKLTKFTKKKYWKIPQSE